MGGKKFYLLYKPLKLSMQIGGFRLSSRFYVVSHLQTSNILLGTDILIKYKTHLVTSTGNDKNWTVTIGSPPVAKVPCVLTSKIDIHDDFVNQIFCNKIIACDTDPDELEETLEPGYEELFFDKDNKLIKDSIKPVSSEHNCIRNNKNIPPECQNRLISFLETIPELYCESTFIPDPFPPHLYQHNIELTTDLP
jgi:hypothetical protein